MGADTERTEKAAKPSKGSGSGASASNHAPIALAHKKRKLGKQIRHFPEDLQSQKLYADLYGEPALQAHTKAPIRRAKRRAKRRRMAEDSIGNVL